MSDFRNYLNEQMKDSEFKKEWDSLEPEFNMIQAMIDARKQRNMTQKELALKAGLTQANVSKIEKGLSHPTIDTLLKIAYGLDKRLVIRLEDQQGVNDYD